MISRILVSGVSGPIGAALLPVPQDSRIRSHAPGARRALQARTRFSGILRSRLRPRQSPASMPSFISRARALSGAGPRRRNGRFATAGSWAPAIWRKPSRRQKTSRRYSSAVRRLGSTATAATKCLNEESAPGKGFLPDVCREWEAATQPAVDAGIRTVQMRTGVVLSPTGGALGKMLTPFKMGVGGKIGNGRQWMSWIDVQDMVGAIHHILKSDLLQGPVNMVAPKPVTNCGIHSDAGQRALAPSDLSRAGLRGEAGLRRNGRNGPAGQPARRTGATRRQRISLPLQRSARIAGGYAQRLAVAHAGL